jgi:hypothetical protein
MSIDVQTEVGNDASDLFGRILREEGKGAGVLVPVRALVAAVAS